MISKSELSYLINLHKKKERDIENKFIVEGGKIVEEGLHQRNECELIICTQKFAENNQEFISKISAKNKIRLEIIRNSDFTKLADTKSPQGILAVFKKPKNKSIKNISSDHIVCLEEISDPGNVGTILRNCDWFGFFDIILSEGCADVYNPKTIRSSMGSVFHINLYQNINLIDSLKKLKDNNYKILCADLEGENIFSLKNIEKSIIVFSNESHGPSEEILKISDKKITILKLGKAESLNVSSASAVILSTIKNLKYKRLS